MTRRVRWCLHIVSSTLTRRRADHQVAIKIAALLRPAVPPTLALNYLYIIEPRAALRKIPAPKSPDILADN